MYLVNKATASGSPCCASAIVWGFSSTPFICVISPDNTDCISVEGPYWSTLSFSTTVLSETFVPVWSDEGPNILYKLLLFLTA